MKALLPLALAPLVVACSYNGSFMPSFMASAPAEPTLAELQPVALPQQRSELPVFNLDQLEQTWRQVLLVTSDPKIRLQALHRLADIEMLQGEERLAEAREPDFSQAIAAYQELLLARPQDASNDVLLYQLSKAYDLSGENEKSLAVLQQLGANYPQSPYFVEAEFRSAEANFSAGNYGAAERAYAEVIAHEDDSAWYLNALYMHGWARFKQGNYTFAIDSFSATLDLLLSERQSMDELSRGDRELADDSFRVLAVIFSYLDGADSIAQAYARLGHRPYEYLLYQQLGDLYLKQERYRDSAESYRAFTRAWPESERAHEFQLLVIETYEAGGFSDLIIEEKQHYVESFAVSGDYWQQSSIAAREQLTPYLQQFIEELASYHHARGQSLAGEDGDATMAVRQLLVAGDYYQLYVDSFPLDNRVPEFGFLLAESRLDAGATEPAITAYEWVAYTYPEFPRAADAAYSAVIAYTSLLANLEEGRKKQALLDAGIESQLRFAGTFPGDARAAAVLARASTSLLEQGDYQLAIIAAATLLKWEPSPDEDILVPAWLVLGHSHYERGEYSQAEQAYQGALAMMPATAPRYSETTEQLAASVYRQAEALAEAGDPLAAADQFARIALLAPHSSVRVQAQYDAASNYMAAEDFAMANKLLLDFRQRFAGNALSATVVTKLIHNYEQLGEWAAAAGELDKLQERESDPERQRQLLYLAAEYYDKAEELELARLRYRSYAHEWPEPLAPRLEAMNRLGELYALRGEPEKRLFWMRKIIASEAGQTQGNPRASYLAAMASSELADVSYQSYRSIHIRAPLKKSLGRKKAAMQRALKAYRQTNNYGVAEFSTLATFRMGEIYRALSADLMDSERPRKLDALALEQYELMLEEQAYPFEEKAIAIHEANAKRSWDGVYDKWVQESFSALASLLPVRYSKAENSISYSTEIY